MRKLTLSFIALCAVVGAQAQTAVPSSWGGTFGFDFKTSKVLTLGTYTYTLTRNSLNIKNLSFGIVGFGGSAVNGPALAGGSLGIAYTMKTWQVVAGYGLASYASGAVDPIGFVGARLNF